MPLLQAARPSREAAESDDGAGVEHQGGCFRSLQTLSLAARRRDDDDDLHAVIVDVSEQGEQVALQLIAARTAVLESYLETLSAADRAALTKALPTLLKLTRKRPRRR
jgi:hypothetical protein